MQLWHLAMQRDRLGPRHNGALLLAPDNTSSYHNITVFSWQH
eukprot:CAMPEP_0175881010 /NCGR_PEP_ID=MMETSP0107_2-20121207/42646_1 /TAXON_ID=195067 ORGANISM="Goniomonas pacifica, Strain CCMP1869" /NCGR_SAMPLE_ID=MMETSP0107_2 /ASSEMBLY_ACC=CAM_ASM_000203 /LENGTH=41 /DNA_ID= /DNA_START= /DNA_END= /DNA_ORIENTATION=